MIRHSLTLLAAATLAVTSAHAEEGMWMPKQLPQISKALKAGDWTAYGEAQKRLRDIIVAMRKKR